ncbi:hypothetical protein KPL71_008908 [Citrus sinensis]|uniref:Uncharacterized protein n=1 Tax=Citrus sinensis TaxID=2711 RepID=A0ACB8M9Q0_CITSI|nr:hypothetical protein KPL71_008908 [Citrus sinensis]
MQLTGFIDADWACDLDDRRSIGAYCIYLGNNLISWSSKKQSVINQQFGVTMLVPLSLQENPMYHSRTKHIEIDMHFIRNKVVAGELRIQYIPSEEQVADIMTKPLSFVKFNYLRSKLNVHLCPLSLRGAVKIAHYGERSNEKQRKEKLKLKRDAEDSRSTTISSDASSAKLVSYS